MIEQSRRAGRASAGDPGRPGSEIGDSEGTAKESSPADLVTDETDYFRLADQPGVIPPTSNEIKTAIVDFRLYQCE